MRSKPTFEPLQADATEFLSRRTGIDYGAFDFTEPRWICVTVREDGQVLGVLIGEFTTWFEVHITSAIDDPKFMTRRLLRAIFTTCFSQAVRVTAMCRPDNDASIRAIRHLGFLYEGYCRLGIEGKWDALVFGMLKHECRWIRAPKEKTHEVADAA
jgi:hypothetical protein